MQVKYRDFVFYWLFFSFKFDITVFVSSIISSLVITELSITVAKYLPFL